MQYFAVTQKINKKVRFHLRPQKAIKKLNIHYHLRYPDRNLTA